MALIKENSSDNTVPFGNQRSAGKPRFERSDRLININIPTKNADGSEGAMKLCVGGLKADNPEHAKLIAWLDENPEQNLARLLHAASTASTYVDMTKKNDRTFGFME